MRRRGSDSKKSPDLRGGGLRARPRRRAGIAAFLAAAALGLAPARAEIVPSVDVLRLNTAAAQRSFLVPGWGQWYKDDKGKAVAIWTLEAGFLAGSAYNFQRSREAMRNFRDGSGPYSRSTRKTDQANFFLIAAAVVWGYGVLDAYLGAPPQQGMTASVGEKGSVQVAWNVRF